MFHVKAFPITTINHILKGDYSSLFCLFSKILVFWKSNSQLHYNLLERRRKKVGNVTSISISSQCFKPSNFHSREVKLN